MFCRAETNLWGYPVDLFSNKLDQKFSWGFLGTVLCIIFGVFAVYTWFHDKKPQMKFEVLSQAPVYDIRENVGKLDILFNGENIREKKQMLSLITIKVSNAGNADILKSSYDETQLPGCKICDAKVIKTDLLSASSDYITNSLRLMQRSDNEIVFSSVILEPDQFFTFKSLILHEENHKPTVQTFGKIAGIMRFELLETYSKAGQPTFVANTFQGSLPTQLTRALCYPFGLIVAVAIIAVPVGWVGSTMGKKSRKKHVKRFGQAIGRDFTSREKALFERYVADGEFFLIRVQSALDLPPEILLSKEKSAEADVTFEVVRDGRFPNSSDWRFLWSTGILQSKGGTVEVDSQIVKSIKEFMFFASAFTSSFKSPAPTQLYGTESHPSAALGKLTENRK